MIYRAAKQSIGEFSSSTPDDGRLKSFVSAFRNKLKAAGFDYQDEAVPLFTNTKNARMYHLLYFSHDKAGLKIWNGIKGIAPGGQRKLL